MLKVEQLRHEFIELLPASLEEGVLYVSVQYKAVVHLCCCGCRKKVVTPLSPTGWNITFDGQTISLRPSVGNWNLECQSHYWISRNKVEWAERWSKRKIATGFARDQRIKQEYYSEKPDVSDVDGAKVPRSRRRKKIPDE